MPLYELMCVATLNATPQQLVHTLQKLAVVVNKGKGVFRRVEHLGTRPLSHRMKAHMKYNTVGRYVRLYIQASPLLCRDVEARLRVDDNIVRTLTIKHKQPAPVVVEKRVNNMKAVNLTSETGILTHSPMIEYHACKALLALGLMKSEDVLSLPRYRPDAEWDAIRHNELIARAQQGNQDARALLQLPIPSRQDDLALMKQIGDKEEEEMAAFESYRKANNQRKVADAATYERDEDAAQNRRMQWYYRSGQQMRDRKLAKKLNGGKKVNDPARVQAMVERHPKRFQRKGKAVEAPDWAKEEKIAKMDSQYD